MSGRPCASDLFCCAGGLDRVARQCPGNQTGRYSISIRQEHRGTGDSEAMATAVRQASVAVEGKRGLTFSA